MTEPLTPPECDCRGLKFMPLDVGRLRDSDLVALSTGDEFKAAVLLWCAAWNQVPAASLPDNDRVLARLVGVGQEAWSELRAMALKTWVLCDDGRFYHPVVAEKAREAWGARCLARELAGRRWSKPDARANASADAKARAKANARDRDRDRDRDSKKNKKEAEGAADATPPPPPAAEATRIAPDWAPGEAGMLYASAHGLSAIQAQDEEEAFRDYWQAKPGAAALKVKWDATWRTWVRRAAERLPKANAGYNWGD